MLVTEGVSLRNRILLVVGNGPSSWWLTAAEVERARVRWPSLVVAACNRTAAKVSAEYAGAVDRSAMAELLDLGVYHRASLCLEREVFACLLRERGEAPAGLVDGENVFTFEPEHALFGSGGALAVSLARCNPAAIFLVGFDGGVDQRTRWQGTPGYKNAPSNGPVLDEWLCRIAANVAAAIEDGLCGPCSYPRALINRAIAQGRRYPLTPLDCVRTAYNVKKGVRETLAQIAAWVDEQVERGAEAATCPS